MAPERVSEKIQTFKKALPGCKYMLAEAKVSILGFRLNLRSGVESIADED